MKKYFLSLGLMVAVAFALTNCTQELQNPVEPSVDGVPFELIASAADTKTANHGVKTVWASGDALNVFHALAGTTQYKSDKKFEYSVGSYFKGELSEELVEEMCYDWYALYPYSSYVTTPAATTGGYMVVGSKSNSNQTQIGNNSMEHIAGENYPLAGTCKDWEYYEGERLEIKMSHLSSLLEVVVTNKSDQPLSVKSVSFTGTEDLVGTYYLNFAGDNVVYTKSGDTYVSETALLKVQDADPIPVNESAKFYLAVKPFTAKARTNITLDVNGCSKEVTLSADAKFVAGAVKTLNFTYDKVTTPGEYKIEWASANDWTESSTKYVSGYYVIKTVKNDGSTDPTVNSKENDCRVYAKGSLTLSHSASANMKKVVFNISANGQKRLTDITASVGNVTVDAQNWKVTWEGSAPSVTFTVGEKATYGTDGAEKHGQLCFDSIDVLSDVTDAPMTSVLNRIEVKDMTTEFMLGETFKFDGKLVAYYYNQEPKEVQPTSVNAPEMTVGNHTVEVTYTEGDVTLSTSYSIVVKDPNATAGQEYTEKIVFSELGYSNAQEVPEVVSGDVKIVFDKGSNSNTSKYYNTGTAVRSYGGSFFTVTAGTTVTKVKFTFGSGDGSNALTADSGNFSTDTWEGSSAAVKFTVGGTSGHRRIAAVEVTYEK